MKEKQLVGPEVERILRSRGQATFGTWMDGLQSLIIQAKTGDAGARGALRQLRICIRELEALGLDVALPGEN